MLTVALLLAPEAAAICTAGAPVPVMETTWGEPAASSVTVQAALRRPAARGVKVTEIEQLAPALMAPVQVVCPKEKSGTLLPPTAVLVM